MYKRWQIIMGLIFWVAVILIISQLATGSLNPFEVFKGESVFLKVVMGICLGLLGLSLVTLPFRRVVKGKVCAAPECGKGLMEFAGPLGNPIKCNFCGRWYHSKCFRAAGGTLLEGCKQPGCATYQRAFE